MLPEPIWTPTKTTLTESNAARWMGVCLRRLTDGRTEVLLPWPRLPANGDPEPWQMVERQSR